MISFLIVKVMMVIIFCIENNPCIELCIVLCVIFCVLIVICHCERQECNNSNEGYTIYTIDVLNLESSRTLFEYQGKKAGA